MSLIYYNITHWLQSIFNAKTGVWIKLILVTNVCFLVTNVCFYSITHAKHCEILNYFHLNDFYNLIPYG